MNPSVYDLALLWRKEANELLNANPTALDELIERCKTAVANQRTTFAALDEPRKPLNLFPRALCQHRLMVLVPALRYAYLVKQGARRTSDPNPLATFLLATALGTHKDALMPARYPVFRHDLPATCVETAREILSENPGLFPPLPVRLQGGTSGLAALDAAETRSVFSAQKAALKKRILSEMQLSSDEQAILARVM